MNIKEVGECCIVARQEVIKGGGRVKNQLAVENIFDEGLTVSGAGETERVSRRRGRAKGLISRSTMMR